MKGIVSKSFSFWGCENLSVLLKRNQALYLSKKTLKLLAILLLPHSSELLSFGI